MITLEYKSKGSIVYEDENLILLYCGIIEQNIMIWVEGKQTLGSSDCLLDNMPELLKWNGKFYTLCSNELSKESIYANWGLLISLQYSIPKECVLPLSSLHNVELHWEYCKNTIDKPIQQYKVQSKILIQETTYEEIELTISTFQDYLSHQQK